MVFCTNKTDNAVIQKSNVFNGEKDAHVALLFRSENTNKCQYMSILRSVTAATLIK